MRTTISIALAALPAIAGCAAAVDDATAQTQPTVAVEGTSAALTGTCEDMKGELSSFGMWAAAEANEARSQLDADPDNDLVVRYFGTEFDRQLVTARLIQIVQLGRSSRVHFICQDPNAGTCLERPTTAFYCEDEKCGHYQDSDDWTLNVCGERFWEDMYKNGQDGGNSASQTGIMVHELAHLAGAVEDTYMLNEAALVEAAMLPYISITLPSVAEAYRLYVMKTP